MILKLYFGKSFNYYLTLVFILINCFFSRRLSLYASVAIFALKFFFLISTADIMFPPTLDPVSLDVCMCVCVVFGGFQITVCARQCLAYLLRSADGT